MNTPKTDLKYKKLSFNFWQKKQKILKLTIGCI